jgi:hypothetical protein
MTIFRDRAINPLKLQREPVEVGGAIWKPDVIFAIVAAGICLREAAIGPKWKRSAG